MPPLDSTASRSTSGNSSAHPVEPAPLSEGGHGPPGWEPFGWNRTDRLLLAIVGVVAAIALCLHVVRSLQHGGLVEIDRLPNSAQGYLVDINRASWIEFAQLEGIGEVLGRRIVSDRAANGSFTSVDDMSRVEGLGTVKINRIRRWLIAKAPAGTSSD